MSFYVNLLVALSLFSFFINQTKSFLHDFRPTTFSFDTAKVKNWKEQNYPVCTSRSFISPCQMKIRTVLFTSSEKGKEIEEHSLTRQLTKSTRLSEGDTLFENINVVSALSGESSPLSSLLSSTQPTVACWFTHMVSTK